MFRPGIRGEGLSEPGVARITQLADVQGALGDQRARSQGRQTVPRGFLAQLHQPLRAEPQQRRVRDVRVGYFFGLDILRYDTFVTIAFLLYA